MLARVVYHPTSHITPSQSSNIAMIANGEATRVSNGITSFVLTLFQNLTQKGDNWLQKITLFTLVPNMTFSSLCWSVVFLIRTIVVLWTKTNGDINSECIRCGSEQHHKTCLHTSHKDSGRGSMTKCSFMTVTILIQFRWALSFSQVCSIKIEHNDGIRVFDWLREHTFQRSLVSGLLQYSLFNHMWRLPTSNHDQLTHTFCINI